jgi:pentatricopeptide repeat protein
MITLILESGKRLQHLLVNHGDEKEQEGQLADFFLAALARITDPAEWLYNQFAHSEKNLRWIGNALLAALSRNNTNGNDALATLRVLQDFDCPMPPDAASRVALQLSEVGSYQEAREVIKRLQEQYLDLPRIPLSRALAVFVKQGDIPAAEEVWKEIDKRFTPSTQDRFLLARVYAQRGIVPTTVSLLRNGLGDALDEDVQALSLIQLAYINALDVNSAAVYLDRIIAIKPCLIAFNRMLSLHASRADVDSAIRTFDSILDHGLRPNRSSYTSLISLFANRRDLANAQNVFHAMAEAGIAPDAVSWAAMLNAEVETGHWVAAAERWNNLPANAKSDKNVITTILKAFVLLASPTSHVLALFRSVKRPNGHLWALAIQSAADNGDLELARSLFDEMDTQALASPTSPKPGVSHLSILLHAYLRENLADEARAMYDEMLNRGIVPSSITYGMIISSFSTISGQHSLDQAHDFAMSIYRQARAEVSRARGTVNENLFGPLLLASGRAGETDDATLYFDLASSPVVSIHSSVHSHTKLMDAYRRAGKVDSVLEVWSKAFQLACDMTARKVNTASVAISTTRVADNILCMPLSIVLDSLSSVGRHADVKRVWNEVRDAGFGFDSQNYNHYAVALARTGDVESAFAVVDRILIARWDEVKERRIAARRATKHLDPVPPAQGEPKIDDIPVAPAFRPPNRRHEQRWDEGDPSRLNSDGANVQLLETWRPTDILWRPSMLTISVLEHAYKQLEEAKFRRAWLGLTSDEAEMEGDVEDSGAISEAAKDRETEALAGSGGDEVFTFPSFGNAPLRDLDGSPRKISASAMIVKLNRKYLKVVSLITLHRRKRAARLEREATRR